MKNVACYLMVLFSIGMLAFATQVTAQETAQRIGDKGWTKVAQSDTDVYMIKDGSFEFTRNRGGEGIETVVGRSVGTVENQVLIYQWYVTYADCKKGMGTLEILDADGKYLGETGFTQDGGNVASGIAEMICGVGDLIMKKAAAKEI